jgi:acetyl esterase/lipase
MIIFIQLFLLGILSGLYNSGNENIAFSMNENNIPVVHAEAKYNVIIEEGITYAEGLKHSSVNSTTTEVIPIKLDVYVPDNYLENRPAMVLIHGGGFVGGTRKHARIVNLANFFAARGWVVFSIDYRLKNDFGTVPPEWVNHVANRSDKRSKRLLAVYPAHRDAKAALRWVAANANTYNINTDYITVGGGSAGAITAIAMGVTNPEDYRDELSITQDSTLADTEIMQDYKVHTILNFWGSKASVDILDTIYGHKRFDSTDAPIFITHGTEDPTVPFNYAEELKTIYDSIMVPYVFYPLEGMGHGAWNATVEGRLLEELAFDFIVEQQSLVVE